MTIFNQLQVKIIIYFILALSFDSLAQESEGWTSIKFAGIQYKIPSSWETDGFGSWKPEEWKDRYRPVKLTREDIVAYAGLNLIGGILMVCIGVMVLIGVW